MTTIASTLGVARSNLVERLERTSTRGRYHKVEDNCLLPLIGQLVDERPSYGYRRITALLNRHLQGQELPKVNAKRVLRILQNHGLVLQRHTGRQIGRTHNGMVIALTSNIRWCSDHFELTCRSGEIVRILFAIDACDREIVAWSATTAGISGEMVQDLMVACVERRFGSPKASHPVGWLSDNGSAYIARETRNTATALGLRLCFTPVRSPQSNGIAEAFMKRPSAATICGSRSCQIPTPSSVCCRLGWTTTTPSTHTRRCASNRLLSSANSVPNPTQTLSAQTGCTPHANSHSWRLLQKPDLIFQA